MKIWHTKKTRNGSKFGWLIQQMSINQNSAPQTFHRRFVSGSLFVSPCLPECYLQSETKIESDLTLRAVGGTCQWLSHFYNILLKDMTLLHVKITRGMNLLSVCWRKLKLSTYLHSVSHNHIVPSQYMLATRLSSWYCRQFWILFYNMKNDK